MQTQGKFILLTLQEFAEWLTKKTFKRAIKLVQIHHTYLPSYKEFMNNHFEMVKAMESYHIKTAHFKEIAQNLTIFPDGMIMICRNFETKPAGIKGANEFGLCIENVGNFDAGKDNMTEIQKKSIVGVCAALCKRFKIPIDTNGLVYHHWFDLNTGKRPTTPCQHGAFPRPLLGQAFAPI